MHAAWNGEWRRNKRSGCVSPCVFLQQHLSQTSYPVVGCVLCFFSRGLRRSKQYQQILAISIRSHWQFGVLFSFFCRLSIKISNLKSIYVIPAHYPTGPCCLSTSIQFDRAAQLLQVARAMAFTSLHRMHSKLFQAIAFDDRSKYV